MPLFKYKASSPDGRVSELLIEGDSQQDSLNRLRSRGFYPLEFKGQADSYSARKGRHFWKRGDFDVYDFTNRLVPLLKAHIQLERALGIIAEGSEDEGRKGIVNDLRRGLHEGKRFSALIRDHGGRFPPLYANLVEAGEETGSLAEVMVELQKFLNDRREMRDFIITSSIYPSIVLAVTFGVIILLFTVFVPRFSKIFMDMGKPLPLPTKIMFETSQFATGFWWLWVSLLAAFVFFVAKAAQGGRMRLWWDEFSLKIPVLGGIIHVIEISRFLRTLAVLLKNHVHLLSTVSISARVIQNSVIARSFSGVASELKGGSKLSGALTKSDFIPKMAVQMLRIGEESGTVGEMLEKVSDHYEKELRLKIKKLLALFEPAVILFMSAVVLAVVISIFMAILEMNEI